MRWKKYSKEKPTNEEHEYLVKYEGIGGYIYYDIYSWVNNLSLLDEYYLRNMEEGGFYYLDSEWGACNLGTEGSELYWIDLTEADVEWSNGKEMQ